MLGYNSAIIRKMIFDSEISPKYIDSVERAFSVILEKGDENHRLIANEILASELLIRVAPEKDIRASGITGLISSRRTNDKIESERLSIREALGEIYIAIAEETIDLGGQRGCEGTMVHEGQHAYDFAQVISSFSEADRYPLSMFDPNLYEMEWEAHTTSANYMLRIGIEEYLQEGLELMLLKNENGVCTVCKDGINRRLRESYRLDAVENQGKTASQMMRIYPK